jgi:hypothetical protein
LLPDIITPLYPRHPTELLREYDRIHSLDGSRRWVGVAEINRGGIKIGYLSKDFLSQREIGGAGTASPIQRVPNRLAVARGGPINEKTHVTDADTDETVSPCRIIKPLLGV